MIASSLTAACAWIVLLPVLYLSGARLASLVKEEHDVMRGIIHVACGLGMLAYFLIFVGSFHFLKREVVLIYALAVLALGFRRLPEFGSWVTVLLRYFLDKGDGFYRLCQIIFLAASIVTLAVSFLPEIAHDALSYQLNLAKLFVRQASTTPWEHDLNSYMPLLMNVLYSVGLLFDSVSLSKLFHWLCGFLLVAGMAVTFEKETRHKALALFLAMMFWLTPAVVNQITTTYVDVAAAFFVFLFFYGLMKGVRTGQSGCLLISGFMLGLAVSTKFLILVLAPPASVVVGWYFLRAREKRQATVAAVLFYAGVFLGCSYWFVRNGLLSGNPFYPYLNELFGTGGMSNLQTYWNLGIPKTVANYLLLPGLLTFYPQHFSSFDWIGPFYLSALPFLVLARDKKRYALPLIFVIYFMTAFFLVLQVVRYLIVILPIYLWAVAVSIGDTAPQFSERLRQLGRAMAGILGIFLLALTCYHYRFQAPALLGVWSLDTYLTKMERSYPAAQWINRNLPADAVVLNAGEVRQFYFAPQMIREIMLFRRTNYPENFPKRSILQYFNERGVTHVLRADNLDVPGVLEARIEDLDKELRNENQAMPLMTLDSKNIREARYRYRVYELKGVP